MRDSGLGTRDSGLGTRDSGLGTKPCGFQNRVVIPGRAQREPGIQCFCESRFWMPAYAGMTLHANPAMKCSFRFPTPQPLIPSRLRSRRRRNSCITRRYKSSPR